MTAPRAHWWNYRIVAVEDGGEVQYSLREAHYECTKVHLTNNCPSPRKHKTGWSMSDSGPHGETLLELRSDLALMLEAFNRPVIRLDTEHRLVKPKRKRAKKK